MKGGGCCGEGVKRGLEVYFRRIGFPVAPLYNGPAMEGNLIQFDLLTQRFITNRWKTPIGRELRDQIITCARTGGNLDELLKPHVLEHPANIEPYDYPFYPPDAMEEKEFWLLTHDDLRGIHLYGEDLANTMVFARKNLGYAVFSECNLSGVDLEMTNLCFTKFERCNLSNAIFAYVTAIETVIIDSNLRGACLLGSTFQDVDVCGSDLRYVYFEDNEIKNLSVNYQTKFNKSLHAKWHNRLIPTKQLADIYRAIRLAYQRAGLYNLSDRYLMQERVSNRRYILWNRFLEKRTLKTFSAWWIDLVWSLIAGYGTRPHRVVLAGLVMSLVYALIYYFAGGPPEIHGRSAGFLGAVYFSLTTFATLGYGDLTYPEKYYILRLLSTSEAILGAILMALFVVIVARKIIR